MSQLTVRMCRTCPRYEAPPAEGEMRRGEALQHAFRALLAETELANRVRIKVVTCLSACSNPCNVMLEAADKTRLRFSRLRPEDAADLVAAVDRYLGSADGDADTMGLPESLLLRLSARWEPVRQSDAEYLVGAIKSNAD